MKVSQLIQDLQDGGPIRLDFEVVVNGGAVIGVGDSEDLADTVDIHAQPASNRRAELLESILLTYMGRVLDSHSIQLIGKDREDDAIFNRELTEEEFALLKELEDKVRRHTP